jgi:hypothetical protein
MKTPPRLRDVAVLFSLAFTVAASPAVAAWPDFGISVAGSGYDEVAHRVVADGSGGMFVAYQDTNVVTGTNIIAKRVSRYGNIVWQTAVSVEFGHQRNPDLCLDPATGGIFVVWEDNRYGNWDIFALRVLADGQVLSWNIGGLRICAEPNDQINARVVSDGVGGAIVSWTDDRNPGSVGDVYALRINDFGNDVWTDDGVVVAATYYGQGNAQIVSDDQGGAVIVWEDYRDTFISDADIYAQRMNAAGVAQWTSMGVPVCSEVGPQLYLDIAADGANGVLVAWNDYRYGGPAAFTQRVDGNGAAVWAFNGLLVSVTSFAGSPSIVSDGAGGAVVAFNDFYTGSWDIFATTIDATGFESFLSICQAPGDQIWASIAKSGANSFTIAWQDRRNGAYDIYAQRVLQTGPYLSPLWTFDGVRVALDYFGSQSDQLVQVVGDADGNAIACWRRTFTPTDLDIYAQRLYAADGTIGHPEPYLTSVADTPGDQGGHAMSTWDASDRDVRPQQVISHYTLWRQLNTAVASAFQPIADEGMFVDPATIDAKFAGTAYRRVVTGASSTTWEFIATIPVRYATEYGFNTPTLSDSVAGNSADETYQVLAHTTNAFAFYESNLRTGHSVDNLSPAPPLMLTAQRVGSDVALNWQESGEDEPDFKNYALYRATSTGVQPIPIHFVDSSGDVDYTDVAPPGGYLYYVVTATDVHGNQSVPSNEANVAIPTGIGNTPALPKELTLQPNSPNPFSDGTVFRLGTPAAGNGRFEVYDVAGRRVTAGAMSLATGWQNVRFDGRDDEGRILPSGVYFYRVQWSGQTRTHKMVIAR